MAITLQLKGVSASAITLHFKTISEDNTSSKMKINVGRGVPVYIKFGFESSVSCTGMIVSSTDYAKLKAWTGDAILECTASTYPEIVVTTSPSTNYIIVDKAKISRKGGYLDQWDYAFTFIQGDLTKLKRWS
jgi:hypothetical protein